MAGEESPEMIRQTKAKAARTAGHSRARRPFGTQAGRRLMSSRDVYSVTSPRRALGIEDRLPMADATAALAGT